MIKSSTKNETFRWSRCLSSRKCRCRVIAGIVRRSHAQVRAQTLWGWKMLKVQFGILVSVTSLIASPVANAQNLPRYCSSEAVREVSRPHYSDGRSGVMKLRYGYADREDPNSPVIIFVPGGPGQTSMDAPLSYPSQVSTVRTDPRGVGCNESDSIPTDSLSSEAIAKDILAIVRDLKPKRYFIHAISYGTIPATIAAARAKAENTQLPEAVILEGTIGKAFQPDEYVSNYLTQWKKLKASLPADVVKQISSNPLPFGLSSRDFATWIAAILPFGTLPGDLDTSYARSELMKLSSSASKDEREALLARIKKTLTPPTAAKTRLYKEIACREFVPDVRDVKYDFTWENGDLGIANTSLCDGKKFDREYDSAQYQIPVPVYYFAGDADPITPTAQWKAHFDGQQGQKLATTVTGGGHPALSVNMSDCSQQVWDSILQHPEFEGSEARLKAITAKCAMQTQVRSSASGASQGAAGVAPTKTAR